MNLFSKNSIFTNCEFETKEELFKFVSKKAYEQKIVSSWNALYEGFLSREKEFSTGLEDGFAIPHAKIDQIKKPHIFVLKMKSKSSIKDYVTFDNSNVTIIFALLIPNKNYSNEHIKIMSLISKKLLDKKFKDDIKNTNDKEKLFRIVSNIFKDSKENNIKNFNGADKSSKTSNNESLKIIGITSCPAGVAHTYLAEESLINAAKNMGHKIRVETQGTVGAENVLTPIEIKEADLLIVASDVKIDLSRFVGKKIYETSVKEPVKNAKQIIEKAIENAVIYQGIDNSTNSDIEKKSNTQKFAIEKKRLFFPHIMTGISWMIPIAICSAILLAVPNLAALFTGTTEELSQYWKWSEFKAALEKLGKYNDAYMGLFIMNQFAYAVLALMIPVFSAFTAYSIADRPGFAPGLIGGFFATPTKFFLKHLNSDNPWTELKDGNYVFKHVYPYLNLDSGFWGAIVIGIAAGYFVLFLNRYIKLNKTFQAMKPMLILPGLGVLFSFISMVFVINPIFGLMNYHMSEGIKSLALNGQRQIIDYLIAPVVGGLTGFDLGGPINKGIGTVVTAIGPLGENIVPTSLAMRCVAIVAAPMAIGLASTLDKYICGRRVFHVTVRKGGFNAIALSFLGISEGGLPALMANPLLVIPINFVCGAIGAIMIVLFGVVQTFPDSAIWGWPFPQLGVDGAQGSGVPLYLLSLLIAIICGTLLHVFLRYFLMSFGLIEKPDDFYIGKISWSKTQWSIRTLKLKAFFIGWNLYFKNKQLDKQFIENNHTKQTNFSMSFEEKYNFRKNKLNEKISSLEREKEKKFNFIKREIEKSNDEKDIKKLEKKLNFFDNNFNEKITFIKNEIIVLDNYKENKFNDYIKYIQENLKNIKLSKNEKIEEKIRKIEFQINKTNDKLMTNKNKNKNEYYLEKINYFNLKIQNLKKMIKDIE